MATVKCKLKKRGQPTHEWNDGTKDRIYCMGWLDPMTDYPLQECLSCPDHWSKAQDDLEKFYGKKGMSVERLTMTNGDKIRSMTDEELREKVWINEAVDMVMERLEALKDEN